ncbi:MULTISPECIES: hypothetical protein [unclassified Nocardiopsis]|uniref:protein kinase domain-containing protein n=1 Tax=unclassified Nocardiopsis TaxID=2649073 RepID=UPI001356F8D2|nr:MULTISPECIES: hypothetical protein [unclassified Nocardiopsis]
MNEYGSPSGVYLTPHRDEVPYRLVRIRADDTLAPAHPLLEHDLVRDEVSDRVLLRVRTARRERPQQRVEAFNALDNEILAGVRLARAASGSAPAELSRLVGYHDDPAEPFALLEPHVGEPLEALYRRRQLFDAERAAFREGLLRALNWLRSCEVVHRDIRPGTVRWDPDLARVQLCGFAHATVAGTPRTAVGAEPWASHEQREGTGVCDPRDDVWSAGLVLFQALSGHDVRGGGVLPLEDFPSLAVELSDVFAGTAAERPGADVLLSRFSGTATPYRHRMDAHLKPGRAEFLDRLGHKREASGYVAPRRADEEGPAREPGGPAEPGSAPADASRRPGGRRKPVLWAFYALVPVLLAAAAILFALTR